MPIFPVNPFSIKSKMGQPKKRTSNNEEMSYKSKEEDLMAHLGNLQLEVSRLHHQLATIQSQQQQQQQQARVKEDISTQRSHQTFSTIGTTQPNYSSGSYPRPSSIQSPSPRFHDGYRPEIEVSSRDRPPPVSQIFIPTPSTSCHTSASFSYLNEYYENRHMMDSTLWMDDGRRSPLRYYRSTDQDMGDDYDVVPRYIRTGELHGASAPKQRPPTGSSWQKHSSASTSSGPTSRSMKDRNRIRPTKRVPNDNPSVTSNPRHKATIKKVFNHPLPLEHPDEFTHRGRVYVPRTYHKCDEGDQALVSNKKRQHREVWAPMEPAEEESQGRSKDNSDQVPERRTKEPPQVQQPYQPIRYKTRESLNSYQSSNCNEVSLESRSLEPSRPLPPTARCILPTPLSTNNKVHHDNELLLSMIRKQRLHLKSAGNRPEKPPLPKDDVGMIFEAIQNGVALKPVSSPSKNSNHQHKAQPNAMLLQLQERTKIFMQQEEIE